MSSGLKAKIRELGVDPDKPLMEIPDREWLAILKRIDEGRGYPLSRFPFVSQSTLMKMARRNYEWAQAALAEKGVREDDLIHIFRGVSRPPDADDWTGRMVGDVVDYKANVLTSWSLSEHTASGFATPYTMGSESGWRTYVLEGYVPRKAVYGFLGMGLGVEDEYEVVVFGDTLKHKGRITQKRYW
jgi:hypothetical protein